MSRDLDFLPPEYIHETSQMAKSYQDDVSQTRKIARANSVSGP